MHIQWFHTIPYKTEQSLLLFFLPSISEKAQSQISVYKSLHLSIIPVYHSWQPETCASATAEIFDVDHEAKPPQGRILGYDRPSLQAECLSFFCISDSLFCVSFCPCFSLGKAGQKFSVSQSLRDLLYYQNNFEYIQCHLKLLTYFVGASVACRQWPCGKDILGGLRSYVCEQKVFCSLSCYRICLQLIDYTKNPLLIPMLHPNCCSSWISASSLVYYKALRY